jgi:small subunit ribosomal protein S20
MANTKSAKKRAAKSAAQRVKNRAVRSKMRTAVKKFRAAVAAGEENTQALFASTVKVVDSTAQKGVIHKNTAARTKSRLAAALKRTAK